MIKINKDYWRIIEVPASSTHLIRTDGSRTIGCTDCNTHTIYIAPIASTKLKEKVLCHELTHAFCFSNNIYMNIEEEERICSFMARCGREIIYILDEIIDKDFVRGA